MNTLTEYVRYYVAHGLEKNINLQDSGGWPNDDEISQYIARLTNNELLDYIDIALDDILRERCTCSKQS